MLSLTCSQQDRLREGPASSVSFKLWAFPLFYDKLLYPKACEAPRNAHKERMRQCVSLELQTRSGHFQIAPNA